MPHERKPGAATPDAARRVVVLIGTGRSGTSLTAKILKALGLRLSDTLQRPNEMNPEGYFEDQVLVDANRQLGKLFSPAAPHVPPRIPREGDSAGPILATIRGHLRKHVLEEAGLWGFKDPRTALLLPTYRLIFQGMGIVPAFVFCARDGSAVVESLLQATRLSRDAAEQVYLTRCLTALRDCAANCHVLHYEKLLEDPAGQIDALARFVWPDGDPPHPLDDAEKRGLVDPKLDRASLKALPLTNPLARRMDALIAGIEGHEFDRAPVLAELRDMGMVHDGYLTWVAQVMDHRAASGVIGLRTGTDNAAGPPVADKLLLGMGASMTALLSDNARLRKARDAAEKQLETQERQIAAAAEAEKLRALQAAARPPADQDAQADQLARLRDAGAALTRQLTEAQAELVRLREDHEIAVDKARQRLATITRLERDRVRQKNPSAQGSAKPAARPAPGTGATGGAARPAAPPVSDDAHRVQQNNAQLRQRIAKLQATLAQERERRQAMETAFVEMENSARHQAGTALVEAVRRPGWRTIALPWRLIRIGTTRTRPDKDNAGGQP